MRYFRILLWAGAAVAAPAHSAVKSSGEVGFAIESSTFVAADADRVYALLTDPARWWSSDHSLSGHAANLTLDARAGGCFCERLPGIDGRTGSVEHGRVILASPGRQLRLSGALGPLQAEAVTGTLSFDIQPASPGVRVTLGYVVGGHIRGGASDIAPIVDRVLAEQLDRLKRAAEQQPR